LRRRIALFAVALIVLLWTTALVAAPASRVPRFSALVYAAGSMVCHQRPERSFHREGAQYPVCARCLGLYAGGAIGAVAWLLFSGLADAPRARARTIASHRLRDALIVTAIPTLVTVFTGLIGWWDPSNSVRAWLALPFGVAIAAVVSAVAAGDLR
jgi:uncharacterized membrane protein